MAAEGNGDLPVPDLRTMEELCQPSLNGRGGTFMKRRLEECYDLIENMTTHQNDWDTSAQQSESSSSITSFSDMEIVALKAEMAKINKNLMRVLQSWSNPPPAYQAPAYQAPGYQAPVHQPLIPQSQVVSTNEFTNFMKANDAILKNMQTNMTSLTNSNIELKNMFGQFMKMNTASSSVSRTLPSNTVTNPKEDLKVERKTEATKDMVPPTNNKSTKDIQPPVVQTKTHVLNFELVVALIIEPAPAPTGRALIDVFEGELTLRVGKEAITFKLHQTSRYLANYNDMTANRIDVIDMDCEDYLQEVLGFSDVITSGNPTPFYDPIVSTSSPTLTPFGDSNFLLEEVDAFLALEDDSTLPKVDHSYFDSEGGILLLEVFLNDDSSLPPPNQGNYLPQVRKELKICEAKTDKSSIDKPPEVELKDLPPHLEYVFLEGKDKLPVIITKDLSDEEKTDLITVLKSHKRAIAWKVFDIKEKSHFMVKEGIILSHKISKNRVEVDKAKGDVIAKLPHPTTVKGIRSFLGHAGFYRRFIQDFSKIARPMTHLLKKDTPLFFSKECVEAFQTLERKLTEAPILIALDWDLPFELMCDASDFAIGAVMGQCQEKHFRPIHYASKTMIEAESNYTTTEKEMLVVVYAFEKFRSYLIMNKIIVYTDHSALKYLFPKKDQRRDCSVGFSSFKSSHSK
uniref:Reverse transcriptase domain-containing protein n=1 Tax=Tanacetum cinerariifolium TaxID=118510 RepID=A0A699HSG8_TANCI|nr:reverse transcriptase domain-containing protein [Tanacetum cinerariifolium]